MVPESAPPAGDDAGSPYIVRPAEDPRPTEDPRGASPAGPPENPWSSAPVPPPERPRPPADLIAVLLGNATLLGLGYAFLRRWGLFVLAVAGSVLLVGLLAVYPGSPVVLTLLALWWAAMIGHGWWLVREKQTQSWPQRIVAGVVVVALVATVVGLRIDTERTVRDAADAHAAGDCERATELLEKIGPTDRIVHASAALDGEADLETCGSLLAALDLAEQDPPQLREAAAALRGYLDDPRALWTGAGIRRADLLLDAAYDAGDIDQRALEAGFAELTTTLDAHPDLGDQVADTVETFLADLAEDPDDCAARDVVEWVDGQDWAEPALAEPVEAASDEVPRRILECARTLAAADDLTASRHTYEAFLHDFRSDRRADAASDELYDVITGIQRKNVRSLLAADRYCANPEPYRGAAPYRRSGGNPMRVFGIDPVAHAFPRSWRAHSLDDMVLVACVDGPKEGSYQETCTYESDLSPWGSDVRFYASRFDVQLYEVRTGRQVAAFTDEFGEPCPPSILVESYTSFFVPPETKRSSFTSAEVRGMFEVYQS